MDDASSRSPEPSNAPRAGWAARLAGWILGPRSSRRNPRGADPNGEPGERAWLQLVAGEARWAVARAACELAARSLARGERVALLDLAPGLRLHEPLGLSPRLGWCDCARTR